MKNEKIKSNIIFKEGKILLLRPNSSAILIGELFFLYEEEGQMFGYDERVIRMDMGDKYYFFLVKDYILTEILSPQNATPNFSGIYKAILNQGFNIKQVILFNLENMIIKQLQDLKKVNSQTFITIQDNFEENLKFCLEKEKLLNRD